MGSGVICYDYSKASVITRSSKQMHVSGVAGFQAREDLIMGS